MTDRARYFAGGIVAGGTAVAVTALLGLVDVGLAAKPSCPPADRPIETAWPTPTPPAAP